MEHIAALLLVVSCSPTLEECRELPSPVTVFETMEECNETLPAATGRFGTASGKVFSSCVYVDPAMEEEDAVLIWDVGKDGVLRASVEAGRMEVASDATRREKGDVGIQ